MYNRYIPDTDGRYRCERIDNTPQEPEPNPAPAPCNTNAQLQLPQLGGHIDTGDLLVLAILALLLLDGEGDELIVLIAAIAFLFF